MTEPDIKALLGKAVGGEPPLGIDRDEVFRRGRRKLRNRRYFEAGGVAAGVVVAVVGAVALSGAFGGEDTERQVPPATSRERPAPPGPTLPLDTAEPSYEEGKTHLTPERAAALTDTLANSGVLDGVTLRAALDSPSSPTFDASEGSYKLYADVEALDATGMEGSLAVEVARADADSGPATCEEYRPAGSSCSLIPWGGVTVAVITERPVDGTKAERRTTAIAVRGETKVTAIATNLSSTRRDKGVPPDGEALIKSDRLQQIVTLPGLSFS